VRRYLVVQFTVTGIVVGLLLWFNASLDSAVRAGGVALTLAALLVWGGLLERRAWAVPVEAVRLVLQIGFAALVVSKSSLAQPVFMPVALVFATALALVSGLLLRSLRDPIGRQIETRGGEPADERG
jgi:hypothetical protein